MKNGKGMICKLEPPREGWVPLDELLSLPVSVVDQASRCSIGTYPVKDLIRKMR